VVLRQGGGGGAVVRRDHAAEINGSRVAAASEPEIGPLKSGTQAAPREKGVRLKCGAKGREARAERDWSPSRAVS